MTTNTPARPDAIQIKVSVCQSNGVHLVVVMRYGSYANCYRFDSYLANFTFLFFTFFQAYMLPSQVSVRVRLALG